MKLSRVSVLAEAGLKITDAANHRCRLFPSVRLLVMSMMFAFLVVANAADSVLNFTVVCMVRTVQTTVANNCRASNLSSEAIDYDVESRYNGDILWTRGEVGNVLAAYYWGMFLSLFAGILFDKYGVRLLFSISFAVTSLLLFLTPFLAYYGSWWIFVARLLMGAFGGYIWPGQLPLVMRWVPKSERGTMMAVGTSGAPLGHLTVFATSGLFCALGAGQWKYAYVMWGSASLLLSAACFFLYADDPRNHRFISETEKRYILETRGQLEQPKERENINYVPVIRGMLKSGSFYAIVVSSIMHGWTFTTIVGLMPMFLKEVVKVDPERNGLFAAFPPLAQAIGFYVFGHASDRLSQLKIRPTVLVKFFEGMSALSAAALFLTIASLSQEQQHFAVPLAIACYFFEAASVGGNVRSSLSIAPPVVGMIACIGQASFGAASTAAPYIFAQVVKNGTAEEWRLVFYTSAGVALCGFLVFAAFGSAEMQNWAISKNYSCPVITKMPSSTEAEAVVETSHAPNSILTAAQ